MPMSPRLLRPIASGVHPEAAAWRTAVVANGGSVSASTMRAVSKFCGDIDAAGIRDRFWRLNLFCGNSDASLNAVRTPLYRGPTRTGTQYGNALDTNNNFVAGDYNETGASGGLIGNTTTKHLATGFNADVLSQSDRHISANFVSSTLPGGSFFLGTDNFGCGGNAFWAIGATNTTTAVFRCSNTFTAGSVAVSGRTHFLVSGNGTAASYNNGVAAATLSLTAFNAPAQEVFVFGVNRCGSITDRSAVRLSMYSIGASFTAGQAASFTTALNAFNTAMSRT